MPHDLDLRAENYDGQRVIVSWDGPESITIERSRQQSGGYEKVVQLTSASQYVDQLPRRNSRDEFYYRIETEAGKTAGPVVVQPEIGSKTAHVRRQTQRHLRRVGEKAHLIEEQTEERCPDCWDEVRRVRKRSKCDTCGGNGYIDGWSDPIEFRACFGAGEPEPKDTQGGDISTLQLKTWTGPVPRVDVGDHVVRDRDREVFRVVKRRPTKKEAHDLRQNLILKLVERGSKARSVAEVI